jgi:galactokinase
MSIVPRPFESLFGAAAESHASAPGRVNLIGEHTDYHEGFVLPVVIPRQTAAAIRARADGLVRAWSAGAVDRIETFTLGDETPGRGWVDYVQGVTAALARRGLPVSGFDLRLESTVPIGAGVSSSAALEVSLLRALRARWSLDLDDLALARVAHAAETEFVGAPVGVMDQVASSLGRDGEALFLDTRTLTVERVPLPPAVDLVVIDSGIAHAHAGGAYATRRRESFDAARALGVTHLRDLDAGALGRLASIEPVLARRARHVITENQRVLDAVSALRQGDVQALGRLMDASHRSMRDDYETSTPEIDTLVAIAQAHPDVIGARLTGGGFGGSIVALAAAARGARVGADVAAEYRQRTGQRGAVLV